MLVLIDQASPIPYQEEDGAALVGEGHMGTRTLVGMEHLSLTWAMVIHTMTEVISHPMGIRIDIRELHSCQGELALIKTS